MPTKRFDNLSFDKQNTILHEARAGFIEHGFEGASLNDIIRRAGISKGSFYYYFEDKSDLYLTVLNKETHDIIEKLSEILKSDFSDDFWGDMRRYFMQIAQYSYQNPDLLKLLKGYYSLSPEDLQKESFKELYQLHYELIDKIITRGQQLGEIRTDLPIDLLNMALFKLGEIMDHWLLEHIEITSAEDMKRYTLIYSDLFRRITSAVPIYEKG